MSLLQQVRHALQRHLDAWRVAGDANACHGDVHGLHHVDMVAALDVRLEVALLREAQFTVAALVGPLAIVFLHVDL